MTPLSSTDVVLLCSCSLLYAAIGRPPPHATYFCALRGLDGVKPNYRGMVYSKFRFVLFFFIMHISHETLAKPMSTFRTLTYGTQLKKTSWTRVVRCPKISYVPVELLN